jgi:hypothetical protein
VKVPSSYHRKITKSNRKSLAECEKKDKETEITAPSDWNRHYSSVLASDTICDIMCYVVEV